MKSYINYLLQDIANANRQEPDEYKVSSPKEATFEYCIAKVEWWLQQEFYL